MKSVLVLLFTYLFSVLADNEPIVLTGVVYDFQNSDSGTSYAYPDFNYFVGDKATTGMVDEFLGDDGKPVFISTKGKCTSEETFNRWWNYDPDWNKQVSVTLTATWDEAKKSYTYDNNQFFPIDGMGWDLTDKQFNNNFGFCMIIHNQFTYQKGQIFDFTGDDDVWVFINRHLELDLGGPHPPVSGSINLDSLGLTEGYTYPFDFFYCERHIWGSTLHFSTSIELSPCGTVDTDHDGCADLCDVCPFGDPKIAVIASGSSMTYNFDIVIGTAVRDGLSLTLDFGDGETTDIYTSIDTSIVHTYEKTGTYTVTVTSASETGCAAGTDTVDVTLTAEGTRIAPKCSRFSFDSSLLMRGGGK